MATSASYTYLITNGPRYLFRHFGGLKPPKPYAGYATEYDFSNARWIIASKLQRGIVYIENTITVIYGLDGEMRRKYN